MVKVKIDDLVEFELKKINKESIIFSPMTREWCKSPYPNHPNGCPNFNKSEFCPPKSPYLEGKLNFDHFYLLLARFNLKKYKVEMKKLHSDWSERKVSCLLYWQNQLRKMIRNHLRRYKFDRLYACGSGFNSSYSMEAVGINVLSTLRKSNIKFEIKPKNKVVLVCLLCCNEILKRVKQQIIEMI